MCDAAEMLRVLQVVNGPMDVVRTIDQMVTKLSPQLMEKADHLTIHRSNISESFSVVCLSVSLTHTPKACEVWIHLQRVRCNTTLILMW